MVFAGGKKAGGFANAAHFTDRGEMVGYMEEDLVSEDDVESGVGEREAVRMLAVWKVRLLGGSGELEARALAWEITASEASTPITEPSGT